MSTAYKNLKKQISFTAIYKIAVLLFNYILIALLIDYLGQENFGIYVALTSLFSWMFLFDLGIAKGMRNFVTLALSKQNIQNAKEYISTAYISILFLTIVACLVIISVLSFVDLQQFLNIKLDNSYLQNIFFILILGFFLKFYLSTVDQLNYAIHQSQNVTLNILLSVLLNVIGVYTYWRLGNTGSVINAVLIFSVATILPYLYSTFYFFYKHKELIPSRNSYSFIALKNILGKGTKILYIQVGFLCIIGLDRLILLKYATSSEVFRYEIIYKVMSIVVFPITILMEPLWSSFSEAFHKGDIQWIKSIFKKFYIILLSAAVIMLVLVYSFDHITQFWIAQKLDISIESLFLVVFLILSIVVGNFYSSFLLGNNKLLYMSIVVTVGLVSKFLVLYYSADLELNTVVISSLSAYAIFILLTPLYIKRQLKVREIQYVD